LKLPEFTMRMYDLWPSEEPEKRQLSTQTGRMRHTDDGMLRPQEKQKLAPTGFLLPHLGQKEPARSETPLLASRMAFSISILAVLKASSTSFPAVFRASLMMPPRPAAPWYVGAPQFEQKLAVSVSFVPHLAQNGIESPNRSSQLMSRSEY